MLYFAKNDDLNDTSAILPFQLNLQNLWLCKSFVLDSNLKLKNPSIDNSDQKLSVKFFKNLINSFIYFIFYVNEVKP
jgi:hypothetical protein